MAQARRGRYFSDRAPALEFVHQSNPDFGILSLPAPLALKEAAVTRRVIGEVLAPQAGGATIAFWFQKQNAQTPSKAALGTVSRRPSRQPTQSLVDRVVADGAFKLADFSLVEAHRPLEPLKQVLRGEADCALIDDAELAATQHIEQGGELRTVWRGAELPGMAVVAFPRADAASVKSLKQSLAGLCAKAKQACASVGIELIRPSSDERYRAPSPMLKP